MTEKLLIPPDMLTANATLDENGMIDIEAVDLLNWYNLRRAVLERAHVYLWSKPRLRPLWMKTHWTLVVDDGVRPYAQREEMDP